LDLEDIKWRLKSQSIWILDEDNNTNFFHKYVAYHKNFNTIWELEREDGIKVSSFQDLASTGKKHFQNLFKDNGASNIGKIMKVIKLLPKLFDEKINVGLEVGVPKEELKVFLSSFKKDKSPRPSSFIWDSISVGRQSP